MNNILLKIGMFFKNLLFGFLRSIVAVIIGAVETIRYILYKLCRIILVFTNIGFIVGIFFLVLNIIEAVNGVFFTQTKYFRAMIILIVCHIIMFNVCRILMPKDDVN